ncbi:MAG: DUF2459 domain-containing protein [Cyclobacteriaceae bacterium]
MIRCFIILFFILPVKAYSQQNSIYVTSISWHTAIIVPGKCIADSLWPENHDYSNFRYLEIGWGDRDFYQTPGFNLWYAAKAFLWASSSAIHIFPVNEFDGSYAVNELVELKISDQQMKKLCQFLLDNFDIDKQGKFVPLQDGIYYNSQFFAGSYAYHFPFNSNVWIAKALKAAGFSICPLKFQLTEWVIKKAKRLN